MTDLRHILLGAGVVLLGGWGICGCNLPPLPNGPEVGTVCEPGQPKRCVSGGLERCNEQGSGYELTGCGTNERCSNGACQPIQNECESDLPFSLSGADMSSGPRENLALRIESSDELPAVSETLTLENCGISPITVEAARIQGAHPAHRYTPWSVADGDSLAGTVVDPKESLRFEFTHSPRFGFSIEPATFHLKVDAGWTREFDIELQPNVSCLTVPPTVDAGTLEVDANSPTRVEIPVRNCGNVDRQVRLPSLKGHRGLDLSWVDQTQTPGDEGAIRGYDAVNVPAGGLQKFALDVSKVETGYREVPLTFRVVERAEGGKIEDPRTRLEVQADELNCDSGFGQPTVHLRRTPDSDSSGASDWSEQLEGTVEPFQPVDMHVEAHNDVRVKLVEAPRGSAARISSKEAEDHWNIVPDVVGTYRIVVWPYNDYGAKGCSEREIRIEVVPKAELHAELTWETAGDSIPGDRGYGRGVDLNLHALSYLPPKQLSGWHKPGDCAARGQDAARVCRYGELESTSVSGVGPEVVSFDHVHAAMAFVARLWHPYEFDAAGATFRLWANGELVAETPVSRVLDGGMGTVWHIGAWSRTDQTFYLADEVRQNYPKEARVD